MRMLLHAPERGTVESPHKRIPRFSAAQSHPAC
jgi:hypothetical protein